MDELKWLDEYSGQTTKELIALDGAYRADSLVLAFEQALQQKAERVGQARLTEEERIVLAVEALEREVNNGGYAQLFMNESKAFAPFFVSALKRIGCADAAGLTQQAIDILGLEGPITVEGVDRVMEEEDEKRDERLGECDTQYYEVVGDLGGALLQFIKQNSGKINLNE